MINITAVYAFCSFVLASASLLTYAFRHALVSYQVAKNQVFEANIGLFQYAAALPGLIFLLVGIWMFTFAKNMRSIGVVLTLLGIGGTMLRSRFSALLISIIQNDANSVLSLYVWTSRALAVAAVVLAFLAIYCRLRSQPI